MLRRNTEKNKQQWMYEERWTVRPGQAKTSRPSPPSLASPGPASSVPIRPATPGGSGPASVDKYQ